MDLDELRTRCSEGKQYSYLYFWSHQPAKDGRISATCLSQWYAAPFEVDGILYPTSEHWMMASKARLFSDDDSLAQILATPSPVRAKELGREVAKFDHGVWTANCRRLVTEGNLAKFGQNDELRAFLLGTGSRVLVEASPVDPIWGIGLKAEDQRAKHPSTWRGQNLLGFVLMDVREALSHAF